MLPEVNRLRSSTIFSAVTKSGQKVSTQNLVMYGVNNFDYKSQKSYPVQFGLIINRSVGGAVKRHKVARLIRHDLLNYLGSFKPNTVVVVRVLKQSESYSKDISELISKLLSKFMVSA